MIINVTKQQLKKAFSSYRDYIWFLVKLSKEDEEIKLPYYNLFADVFASNGEGMAYIYSDGYPDGKTVTIYREGVIEEVDTVSEVEYDSQYVDFMCKQYTNEKEVIINE